MSGLRLLVLVVLAACGNQGGPSADASAEADGPHAVKVCDPCKFPTWSCTDNAHWTAEIIVECPSSACPAFCASGAWCASGPVQSCEAGETCDSTTPRDAGSPCVPLDAGTGTD